MANQVHTRTIGQPGLFLATARHNHLLSGASAERGGDGHAWLAGELLLAALAGCASSIVAGAAAEQGIALAHADVHATSEKDASNPGHYASITLSFVLRGPTQAEAEALVALFQRECPIYGTLARGAPMRTSVRIAQ